MNEREAIKRLDEIEQLDPDPTFDVGALEIMETLAERPEGLRLLVERYSASPSANIAVYLALVLGKNRATAQPKLPLSFSNVLPDSNGKIRMGH
jgi:hypothetical protein